METIRTLISDFLDQFFTGTALQVFTSIGLILFWIILGIVFVRVTKRSLRSFFKIRKNDRRTVTIGKLINSITKVTVWFIILIIILSELGVDVAPFLASAGILGLAVGFGAQSIVKDVIAGLFFILEHAYYVDDVVEINGFLGTIVHMGLRSTSLVNWTGQVKIISNGDIKDLINYSKADSIAIVDFGVHYKTDLKNLSSLMPLFLEEVEKKYDKIVETPNFLGVTELADSSINLRIIAKTVSNEQHQIERNIRADLIDFLNKNNIEIPFPQVVVHNAKEQ
jgi:moderate conductance mechanosensitive channel